MDFGISMTKEGIKRRISLQMGTEGGTPAH
jgi:hypothetical protein